MDCKSYSSVRRMERETSLWDAQWRQIGENSMDFVGMRRWLRIALVACVVILAMMGAGLFAYRPDHPQDFVLRGCDEAA